jgi:hypothetical protein
MSPTQQAPSSQAKAFKWLRGIHRATHSDSRTNLNYEVVRNLNSTGSEDKFAFRCRDAHGKLFFDRKINFGLAMVVINTWNGDMCIEEVEPSRR